MPRRAYVKGRGLCRVLSYEGNGYFTLLTKDDRRIHIHRDRCTFTKH